VPDDEKERVMAEVIATVKKEVAGQDVEIQVTKYLTFQWEHGDGTEREDSWEKLEPKIARALRVAKIEHAIPVVLLYGEGGEESKRWVRAILRGKHSRTSEFLLTVGDKKVRVDQYQRVMPAAVTDEQIAKLNALLDAAEAARKAANSYANQVAGSWRERVYLGRVIEDAEKKVLDGETGGA
jgi:hypothetical protein